MIYTMYKHTTLSSSGSGSSGATFSAVFGLISSSSVDARRFLVGCDSDEDANVFFGISGAKTGRVIP